jgi:ethanolamine utilization protein EutQ
MKTLITASDVRAFAKTGQKTMNTETGTIITPAAWDEARELSVSIEIGAEKSVITQPNCASEAVNPEFLAKVVGQVIACLQKGQSLTTDTDPCGLKLIRGERLEFFGATTGGPSDKKQTAKIVSDADSRKISAQIVKLDDTSFSYEPPTDETLFIASGKLDCTVGGTRYCGSEGDSFYLPARCQVTISTPGKATLFAACAV